MKYDAFISYKHAELDSYIAKKVHKFLETYRVPKSAVRLTGKKRINRVFRDQEELPIGSDLGGNIEAALRESEYLIVICSPRTLGSEWVLKEIRTFISMHSRENVLAILIEGEPSDSFPKELLVNDKGQPVEPLAADVRGQTKSEINKKFKTEMIRLAAPLLGCSYDDLKQRHRERQIKRRFRVMTAIAILSIMLGVFGIYNYQTISRNYNEKQINQSKYLADTALDVLDNGDRKTAALIAKEALPGPDNDRPYVTKAQYALTEALGSYDVGEKPHVNSKISLDFNVAGFDVNEEFEVIAAFDEDNRIYLLNLFTGELLFKLTPNDTGVGLDNDNNICEIVVNDENIVVFSRYSIVAYDYKGNEEWACYIECRNANVSICKKNNYCVYYDSNKILLYDISKGELINSMDFDKDIFIELTEGDFSQNGNFFALAYRRNGDDSNVYIKNIELETFNTTDLNVVGEKIFELAYAGDDSICAVVGDNKDYSVTDDYDPRRVVLIDVASNQQMWNYDFNYYNEYEGIFELDYISKNERMERQNDEVFLVNHNSVTVINKQGGTIISNISIGFAICSFWTVGEDGYCCFSTYDGDIMVISSEGGIQYADEIYRCSATPTPSLCYIGDGVLVVSDDTNKDIIIVGFDKGSTVKEVRTIEEYTSYYMKPDGKEYAYFNLGVLYFYEGDKLVDEVDVGTFNDECLIGFVNDDFVFMDTDESTITFYNYEKEKAYIEERFINLSNYFVSSDNSKLLVIGNKKYWIYDLKTKQILYENRLQNEFKEVSNSDSPIIAVSNEGNKIAYVSPNNIVRILDVEQNNIIHEFDGFMRKKGSMFFNKDDSQIIIKSDDFYLRTYDLEKNKFVFCSEEQYDLCEVVLYDDEEVLLFVGFSDMYIVDAETYEYIAFVDGGVAFLPEKEKVYIEMYGTVYEAEYMTLDKLLAEEEKLYPNEELSDMDRVKYNVD